MRGAARLLVSFFIGVVVGVVVFAISMMTPFLMDYASLLGVISFVIGWYVAYRTFPPARL